MDLSRLQVHAGEAASLLQQLANPNRLMIVCTLIDGEMSVGELNERIALSQSALSQHLANLRKANLVATRREGQTIFYRIHGDRAVRVVALLKELFCPDEDVL
ncbi:metalloregulator ArsR/SmtB family transcription factor [Pseudomaricurvus sp.]|uniref:metalloregulator ArsR/SmtB family transcription factor n=1 Tax=Pseudomaricurvus sp. TaxID=2004510 RepID=UPI003F6D9F1C